MFEKSQDENEKVINHILDNVFDLWDEDYHPLQSMFQIHGFKQIEDILALEHEDIF